MSSPNPAHIEFIARILHEKLTLAKDKYTSPLTKELPPLNDLHCAAIPSGTSKLIFRLPKETVSLENSIRTRNEIAFLALAREALKEYNPSLIPVVYGWDDDSKQQWILEEWKVGEVLKGEKFKTLDVDVQKEIMRQMVAVARCFQEFELSEGARGFGGLTFDDKGVFSNTLCVLPCGGPFKSYAEFLETMCKWQLEASDRSEIVGGWREFPEMRARVDKFFAEGLDQALEKVPVMKPTLTHADFGLPNMLFDSSTYKLTAVLDFDFSHVGAPISEYLFSYYNVGGLFLGTPESDEARDWMINGFPAEVPEKHKAAQLFDSILAEMNVQRPSTVKNAGFIADLWWFSQFLCHPFLLDSAFIAKAGPERLKKMTEGDKANIEECLTVFGF